MFLSRLLQRRHMGVKTVCFVGGWHLRRNKAALGACQHLADAHAEHLLDRRRASSLNKTTYARVGDRNGIGSVVSEENTPDRRGARFAKRRGMDRAYGVGKRRFWEESDTIFYRSFEAIPSGIPSKL